MKRHRFQTRSDSASSPSGMTLVEVLIVLVIIALLAGLCFPLVQQTRERSRQNACRFNLRTLTLALHQYEETHMFLPVAAHWDENFGESILLHESKYIDRVTMENWAILLLPHLDQTELSQSADTSRAIGDPANLKLRTTRLPVMSCSTDSFSSAENHYDFLPPGISDHPTQFARGNYAINGGTQNHHPYPPSTISPRGDQHTRIAETSPRRFQQWNNGIAGINKNFSSQEFLNGKATLVALEELRAGIHPLDPRGVWSLGQIGGSITYSHGAGGDDFGPNQQWERADDILGCKTLHKLLGKDVLMKEAMPCVDYIDANEQATARSLHNGGANLSFMDGSVRFISDKIDSSLWHVMHGRDTPAEILAKNFEEDLNRIHFDSQVETRTLESSSSIQYPEQLENSIGMKLQRIPAGTFEMGVPDTGMGVPPVDVPPHQVTLSNDFLMGVHEVTRGQYRSVIGRLPESDNGEDPALSDNHPVTNVTWDEANAFVNQLSRLPDEAAAGRKYRLPTEAEWEYVCREGRRTPYNYTSNRLNTDSSGEAAGINPALPLLPVGSYPPNKFGIHDMRGNAWEWTGNWFSRGYYKRSPNMNPQGPAHGYLKVIRGADWRFVGEICHIDYPNLPPWKSNQFVSFRVILNQQTMSKGSRIIRSNGVQENFSK